MREITLEIDHCQIKCIIFKLAADRHATRVEGRVRFVVSAIIGYEQRYDRVADLLEGDQLRTGYVGHAWCHLLDAAALKQCAVAKLRENPLFFVER